MAKTKTAAVIDTSAGTAAYALATQNQAALQPRLPAGTLATLAEDLTLLGANPTPPAAPAPPAGQPAPAPALPTLAEATATAVALITAIHGAIQGAKPSSAVRKAYGASAKSASKEPKAVIAEGEKILTQAQSDPSQALSLGILPADTTALSQALAAVTAAEAAAKSAGGKTGATAKQLHAAEVSMHEAVARIAGAGALAFATNAAVRAQFEALKPKKKKA
jgi:hypothetical protein